MPSIAKDRISHICNVRPQVEQIMRILMINAERGRLTSTRIHSGGCSLRSLSSPFVYLSFIMLIIWASFSVRNVEAVDCFKCSSRNGSNPACEDPFHNVNTTKVISAVLPEAQHNVIYHAPCYAGKKGRDGLFPASACLKLVGTFEDGGTLVVRHCALDSGTLTQDTELARMSHCGKFQFEGDLLQGCVLACPDDACNAAPANNPPIYLYLMTMAVSFLLIILVLFQ